ncbi:MAG: hypothetical protein MUC96_24715 [Myxococcaceae bacterium]|jgi:hypothetical protein|nr:hypothetical protein [Myxococcaceae bacterium]
MERALDALAQEFARGERTGPFEVVKTLRVVEAPLGKGAGGMEFPGLITVSHIPARTREGSPAHQGAGSTRVSRRREPKEPGAPNLEPHPGPATR